MLKFDEFLLYNEIVGEVKNTEFQYPIIFEGLEDIGKQLNSKIEADVLDVTIPIAWPKPPVEFDITLGFPLDGLILADSKGNDIISGKELKPVFEAFESGDYVSIGETLYTLFQEHSEDFAKTMKAEKTSVKELEETALNLSKLDFLFKIERARIYIPYTGKLSKAGLKFYQEATIWIKIKPDPKTQRAANAVSLASPSLASIILLMDAIKKIELNDFVIEGVGRINVTHLLKIYIQCAMPIAQMIVSFVMIILGQIKNGELPKLDELEKQLHEMMNKSVKSSIGFIKKLPETVELDSKLEATVVGATLEEIAASEVKNLSIY